MTYETGKDGEFLFSFSVKLTFIFQTNACELTCISPTFSPQDKMMFPNLGPSPNSWTWGITQLSMSPAASLDILGLSSIVSPSIPAANDFYLVSLRKRANFTSTFPILQLSS